MMQNDAKGHEAATMSSRRSKPKVVRVTVGLDERDYQRLVAVADKSGTSLALVIRTAVRRFLDEPESEQLVLPLRDGR